MTKLEKFAAGFFEYRERLSVEAWATANVELSARITEQPGPYTTRLHPYVSEILEGISNAKVKRISLCWEVRPAKQQLLCDAGARYRPRPQTHPVGVPKPFIVQSVFIRKVDAVLP